MYFSSLGKGRLPLGPSQPSLQWAREFFPGWVGTGGGNAAGT